MRARLRVVSPSSPVVLNSKESNWLRPSLVASWREIAIVLLLVTGPFLFNSALGAWKGTSNHYFSLILTNSKLLGNIAIQASILGLLLIYLQRRGWLAKDFKIRCGVLSSLQAIPLTLAMMLVNTLVVVGLYALLYLSHSQSGKFLSFVAAHSQHVAPHSIHVGWLVIITAMVLNAFFEEIICIGYAFNQFAAKQGPFFALLLIVMVRMAYHTYEGPIHMLGVGASFFVSGLVYWWTRNLWPLIVSHALIDLGSASFLKIAFS